MRHVFTLFALILGVVALLGSWLLWVVPPGSRMVWALPVLVLLCSLLVIWRLNGLRFVLPLALIAAALAWGIITLVWPGYSSPVASSPADVRSELPVPMIEIPVSIPARYALGPLAEPRTLTGPEGLTVQVFAAGLGPARFMCVHPTGAVLVSVPKEGRVLALPDRDHDGVADRVVVFADGLDRPHGLARSGFDIIVAEHGRLVRLADRDGDLQAEERAVLSDDLPTGGGHWTRSVVIGTGGGLFVSAGSSCNVCEEEDPRRATIMQFKPDGGPGEVFASGLRNSVGMAVHPETGGLWASDNGRDMLGDELPPEEINRIVAGADYGWPYCYGDRVPDPELGSQDRCRSTRPPEVTMQAHSAPLGITFGRDLDFPPPFRDMLYVAFHGSWNRRIPTGYKLVGIPFAEGRPAGAVVDIVTGWLVGREAWGRPVDPLVGRDGALYLSDDRAGAVYRLSWREPTGTAGAGGY